MIASELSGVTVGIGAQTILAQNTFEFDDMWAGVLLLAVVGLGANLVFRLVRHFMLGWYRGWRRSSQFA
jgi:sulfonate transport system permease protein